VPGKLHSYAANDLPPLQHSIKKSSCTKEHGNKYVEMNDHRPSVLFNWCAWCTLGCIKICVGCTTMKGFTRMHYKLITLNGYFLQKLC